MSKDRLRQTADEIRYALLSNVIARGMAVVGAGIEVRAQGKGARQYPVLQGSEAVETVMRGADDAWEGEPTQRAKMTVIGGDGKRQSSSRTRIPK